MGRDLRHIPPGSLVEITNRTIHGRFLLRPSEDLNTIIVGALGRAQRLYGLRIIAYVFLSNHFHALAIADDAQQLSSFIGYVEAKIAKEAGRLHNWRECFWPRRFQGIVVSDEPEVQVARLRYLLAQGCKEGLVASPRHWPGASSTKALLTGQSIEGLWFDRTKEYKARRKGLNVGKLDFAEPETLALSPLPCWQTEPEHQIRAKIRALVRDIEVEVDERVQETQRPPMGARAIRQQHPHDRPAHSKRSPAPRFHAKSGEVRGALERAYQRFY
jgi:hypothetical protein